MANTNNFRISQKSLLKQVSYDPLTALSRHHTVASDCIVHKLCRMLGKKVIPWTCFEYQKRGLERPIGAMNNLVCGKALVEYLQNKNQPRSMVGHEPGYILPTYQPKKKLYKTKRKKTNDCTREKKMLLMFLRYDIITHV